jgi:hypothetical protein
MNIVIDSGIVAVIIGLVSVAKATGLNARWAPLLSILLGIIGTIGLKVGGTVPLEVFFGVATGLTASGLFSGAAATFASVTTSTPLGIKAPPSAS